MSSGRDGAGHDEDGLDAVRFRWSEAYEIGHDPDDGYWARRRDALGGLIAAFDAQGLDGRIAEDFRFRAVPRQRGAALGGAT